jgi:acetyltransferase-like isoleucine patch superfamily enzyme
MKENYIVYENVQMGSNIIIEPYAIIGIKDRFHSDSETIIGDDSFIGSRCTIYQNVRTGNMLDISDQTSIFYDNIIGDRVRIGPKSIIKNSCVIGDDVRINSNVFMERVIIGSNVFIGPGVIFTDDKHPPCPKYKDCVPRTNVESYVSIGAGVIIAPGVSIGSYTQIYSGSVVTKDIPPNSVVSGNPAKIIKRFDELECTSNIFKKPFEWWNIKNNYL